jgi:hypothetical protein
VQIQGHAGGARVRVDGGVQFNLPPSTANLLRVLLEVPSGPDGFPEWQTFEQAAAKLSRRLTKSLTTRSIGVAVARLRKQLSFRGVNPALIQVGRGRRLRFMLKRREPQLTLKRTDSDPTPNRDLRSTAARAKKRRRS